MTIENIEKRIDTLNNKKNTEREKLKKIELEIQQLKSILYKKKGK